MLPASDLHLLLDQAIAFRLNGISQGFHGGMGGYHTAGGGSSSSHWKEDARAATGGQLVAEDVLLLDGVVIKGLLLAVIQIDAEFGLLQGYSHPAGIWMMLLLFGGRGTGTGCLDGLVPLEAIP